MMREIVGAICLDHPLDLFLVRRDLAELRPERRTESLDPHVVGGHRFICAVQLHRVSVGAEDQLDRIDDRAVEVEEESAESHAMNLASRHTISAATSSTLPGASPTPAGGTA